MNTLKLAGINVQVALSLREDFHDLRDFAPREHQHSALATLLDELLAWSTALGRTARHPAISGLELTPR